MSDKLIPTPSVAEVEKYLERWKNDNKYSMEKAALEKLLVHCKGNTDISQVLLKVAVIDRFYSTNVYYINDMAEKIVGIKDLDSRLTEGDESVIDEIKSLEHKKSENEIVKKNCYSFASKYCSYHAPTKFPIYDSFVDKMLWHFKDEIKLQKRSDLREYKKFKNAIDGFKRSFGLERYSYKEVDIYLWQCGKDYFAKPINPAI